MDWMGLKGIAADLGLTKDALHIYVAVLIQVSAAFALKRPLSSWLPWGCVLAAELFNEFLDLWFGEEATIQAWQIEGATHDLLNTMAMPTALLLLARFGSPLFEPRPAVLESGDGPGADQCSVTEVETDIPEREPESPRGET